MAFLSSISLRTRPPLPRKRNSWPVILLSAAIGAMAIALIAYLLWPTFTTRAADDPNRLPVTIGNTLFNVPTQAIRVKVQKRSGPQERVDLGFAYPSLDAPTKQKVTAETADAAAPAIDRIFVSIAAHHNALAPDERARTIYPRYLDSAPAQMNDGLGLRAFRDGSPYANEDVVFAERPALFARCTRDAATPGMCISERRIDGADLTFRFPRSWLSDWRQVANAVDRLIVQMRGPGN